MANWSDLKSAVASIIKTNGAQEITGQLLQNVLNNIISNVGLNSTFAGIATPETNPGTPDGNVFYLATTAGTYSNFNGIVINSGESVILEWKGSWVKKDSGFATKEKLSELEENTNQKLSELGSEVSIGQTIGYIAPYGFLKNASPLDKSVGSADRILMYYMVKNGDRIKIEHTHGDRFYVWSGVTNNIPVLGESVLQYSALNIKRNGSYYKMLSDGYFCVSPQKGYEDMVLVSKYEIADEVVMENHKAMQGEVFSLVSIPNLMPYAYNNMLNYDVSKGDYINKCFRIKSNETLTISVIGEPSESTVYCGFSEDIAYYGLAITTQSSYLLTEYPTKSFVNPKDCYLNIAMVKEDWGKVSVSVKTSFAKSLNDVVMEVGAIKTIVERLSQEINPSMSIVGLSPLGTSIGSASRTMLVYPIKEGERFRIKHISNESSLYAWIGITVSEPSLGSEVVQYSAYDLAKYTENIFKAEIDGYLCISTNSEFTNGYVVEIDLIGADKCSNCPTSLKDIKGVVSSTSEQKIVNASNYSEYICKCFKLGGNKIVVRRIGNAEGFLFFGKSNEVAYVNLPVTEASNMPMTSFSSVVFEGEGYINISTLKNAWEAVKIEYLNEGYNDVSESNKQIALLGGQLKDREIMFSPLFQTPLSDTHDTNILTLKKTGKQKLLIGLHKSANDGSCNNENDAYLPNARKDFSDVRVCDEKGNILPFSVVHRGNYELLEKKSMNGVSSPILSDNGAWYCVNNGKVSKSVDGGNNWQDLFSALGSGQSLCCITKQKTMLFGANGIVYRSEYPYTSYSEVLNENLYHNGSVVLNTSIKQDSKGNLYLGHYQTAKDIIIQKSVDDGKTWSICFRDDSGLYQHIHNITIDPATNAVYVSCDGGGGVYKSTDEGVTWTDLRTQNPDMPQVTDYGMIYFGNGYKLMSGETSIVGGYSIIKTKNETEYYPVLDAGGGTYYIVRSKNGNLYAGMVSSEWYRQASIFMSYDEGESWKQIYRTALHDDGGASDGFRETSIVEYDDVEYVVFAIQGDSFRTKLLIEGGDNYCAQILVDVPDGCNKIYVEDGYMLSNIKTLYNDEKSSNPYLYVPLNDGGQITEYWWKGEKKLITNDFKYVKNGRTLGNIRPITNSSQDLYSVVLGNGESAGFFPINISNGGFHIGCWVSRNITQTPGGFVFMEKDGKKLSIWKGSSKSQCLLGYDGTPLSKLTYGNWVGEELMRVDINVFSDGVVEVYVNGEINEKLNAIPQEWLSSFTNSVRLLYNMSSYDVVVQQLEVTEYTITAEQAITLYSGNMTDNL